MRRKIKEYVVILNFSLNINEQGAALSGRSWQTHVRGRLSAATPVIRSPHCSVQYVELRGYCPV